jgi:hypothetical protein
MTPADLQKQIYFRGIFMSFFCDIEFILSDVISKSLVGENKLKLNLMEFLTPNLMLDKKILLLTKILSKKFKVLDKEYEKDLKLLRKIAVLRNSFAHKKIEIDIKKEILHFVGIEDSKISRSGNTFKKLDDDFEKLKHILKRLNELHAKIITT